MSDNITHPFAVLRASEENIKAGLGRKDVILGRLLRSFELQDVMLKLLPSADIDRPQITVILGVPVTGPIVGATGMSNALDVPVGLVVDAEPTAVDGRSSYSPSEAAGILGMSQQEVESWVDIGLIPGRRIAGQVRVSARWLNRYRPTAEAVKWMGLRISTDELVHELRQGRRSWTWPPMEQIHGA